MKLFSKAGITDFSKEQAKNNCNKMFAVAVELEKIDAEESERAFKLSEIFYRASQ